jgi:hypothetical protein
VLSARRVVGADNSSTSASDCAGCGDDQPCMDTHVAWCYVVQYVARYGSVGRVRAAARARGDMGPRASACGLGICAMG